MPPTLLPLAPSPLEPITTAALIDWLMDWLNKHDVRVCEYCGDAYMGNCEYCPGCDTKLILLAPEAPKETD